MRTVNADLAKRRKSYHASLQTVVRTGAVQQYNDMPLTAIARMQKNSSARLSAAFMHPPHTLTNRMTVTMVTVKNSLAKVIVNAQHKDEDEDEDEHKHKDEHRVITTAVNVIIT